MFPFSMSFTELSDVSVGETGENHGVFKHVFSVCLLSSVTGESDTRRRGIRINLSFCLEALYAVVVQRQGLLLSNEEAVQGRSC